MMSRSDKSMAVTVKNSPAGFRSVRVVRRLERGGGRHVRPRCHRGPRAVAVRRDGRLRRKTASRDGAAVCRELYFLADEEDDQAAAEAARAPYWATCPASIVGHRKAAQALRSDASRLEKVLRDAARSLSRVQ
jgi:hypothetical protein